MDNTLYYTFSAIPQVLGAIAAVIAAFIHFRIANLREYLIGDGKSVLHRWGNHGYKLDDQHENQKQEKRLRDAIDRKSIPGIKDIILLLRDNEINQGYTKLDRPTGLQYLYEDRFCPTDCHIKMLNIITVVFIAFSFFTIIVSIVSLAMTASIDSITHHNLMCWILWGNVILFIASLIFAFSVICIGLVRKSVHEKEIPSFESDDKQSTQTYGVNPPTNSVPKQ